MGIWERLGTVISSYLNADDERIFGRSEQKKYFDPDLNAAYEELDDFLQKKEKAGSMDSTKDSKEKNDRKKRAIPAEFLKDLAELGLTQEAGPEDCKEAYKRLIKIHHPDRHANHEGNLKKATDKTTRVNASYERLMKWFNQTL